MRGSNINTAPQLQVLLALVQLLLLSFQAAGQGLPLPGKPGLAARDYSRVRSWAAEGAAWRASYAAGPAAACNPQAGLCAANPGSEDFGKLLVATSPADYDARTAAGSFDPISPVQDQRPCQAAVAFAVITAAEAAVASALHINATSVSLSQQDLQFCPDAQRTCQDSWDVRAAVDRLVNGSMVAYDCLPYTAATTDDPAKLCNYRCKDQPKQLQGGRFRAVAVRSPMEGQRHIRRYGSFVTRFNVYQDFLEWIRSGTDPNAVYECPSSGDPPSEGHAVAVIGYNNTEGTWLVKNSWGTGNADKGFFKVRYGVCGMLASGDTLGVSFIPAQPLGLRVTGPVPDPVMHADNKSRTCYSYTVQPGDFTSKVADAAVIRVGQLLLDNNSTLKDLDKPLEGSQLLLCDPDPTSVTTGSKPVDAAAAAANSSATNTSAAAAVNRTAAAAPFPAAVVPPLLPDPGAAAAAAAAADGVIAAPVVTSGPAPVFPTKPPGPTPSEETEALLALKEALGFKNAEWQEGTSPCGVPEADSVWPHLYCNSQRRVYMIDLSSKGLTGTLSDAVDLSKLPSLQALWLYDNPSLQGSLPSSWSTHERLREVSLYGCSLTGPLPSSWGAMRRLRQLFLQGNKLTGSLPEEWGSLAALNNLGLAGNELSGSIPSSWAGMRSLKSISLYDNAGLSGCLPTEWISKSRGKVVSLTRPAESVRPLAGTQACRTCSTPGVCKARAPAGAAGAAGAAGRVVPPSGIYPGATAGVPPVVAPTVVPPKDPLAVPPQVVPPTAMPPKDPLAVPPQVVPPTAVPPKDPALGMGTVPPQVPGVGPGTPSGTPGPGPLAGPKPAISTGPPAGAAAGATATPSPSPAASSPSPAPKPSPSPAAAAPSPSPAAPSPSPAAAAVNPGAAMERAAATPADAAAAAAAPVLKPASSSIASGAAGGPAPGAAAAPTITQATTPAPPPAAQPPSPPMPTPVGSLPVPVDPSTTVIRDNRKPTFQDTELSGNRRLLWPSMLQRQP